MHPLLGVALLAAAASPSPDPTVLVRQAGEAYAASDYTAAASRYREVLGVVPSLPGALVGLGRSLARLGRTAEALDWLSRAADSGAGTDAAALQKAFGEAGDSGDVRALLARFRGNLTPVVKSSLAFRLAEKDLLPESVAHDPEGGAWYVGSMRKRKVVVVRDGAARDFVPAAAHGLGMVLGMKVDAERRELLVNSCHADFTPAIENPEPGRVGETAVYRFALGTGALVAVHRTGSRAQPVCFNDIALTPQGDVYTSTGADGVFRVSRESGRVERFSETPGLLVNGIAAAPDGGRLYLADHMRGVIVLDLASRELRPLQMPPAAFLGGIDGLYVHGKSLVGIQNGLSAGPERVVQAFLDPDGGRAACVALLERNHPDYDVPTTGVIVGNELVYVAGSQLNRLDESGRPLPADRLRESAVLRLGLAPGCSGGGAAGAGSRLQFAAGLSTTKY